MEFFGEVLSWFGEPARWAGPRGIPMRVYEHLLVSFMAAAAAAACIIPPAVTLAHYRRGAFIASAGVNIGRAVPSLGIIVLAAMLTVRAGLGMAFWPTFVALFALALPPIFTNTYTGVSEVDPAAVEAARGTGMREREIMGRIELPLAAPLVVAGLRVATVQVIATATLGAVLAYGGLGRYIIDGLARRDYAEVFGGAVLVAGLTVATEGAFTLAERRFLAPGTPGAVETGEAAETKRPTSSAT